MKNTVEKSSKSLIIVGNSFISESLYNSYKRNGKMKVLLLNDTSSFTFNPNYIIDCTFDKFKQDQIISYCDSNKIEKLLIINHWERNDLPKTNTIILQSIVYDIYGNEHMSFHRHGTGNKFIDNINYCTFITESIRRIHEAKVDNLPLVYIPYGEIKVKYIHVDNLYEPINYMLTTFKKDEIYSIYDNEKSTGYILSVIKTILDYSGDIIEENIDNIYTKYTKSLDFNFKKNYFDYEIKKIYNYLKINNSRFMI